MTILIPWWRNYEILATFRRHTLIQILDPLWYQVDICFSARVLSDIWTTYYTNSCRRTFSKEQIERCRTILIPHMKNTRSKRYGLTSSTVDIDRQKFTSSLKPDWYLHNGSGWTFLSTLHVGWANHRSSNTVASTGGGHNKPHHKRATWSTPIQPIDHNYWQEHLSCLKHHRRQ